MTAKQRTASYFHFLCKIIIRTQRNQNQLLDHIFMYAITQLMHAQNYKTYVQDITRIISNKKHNKTKELKDFFADKKNHNLYR